MIEFALIPAGEFDMGSPSSEEDRYDDEGPVHHVKISKPFYMGKFQVTQEQYKAIIGTNPSGFSGSKLPVENISWDDAVEFCDKLSQLSHKEGKTYRLPTEAEWEYACRAGSQTRFCFGDDVCSLDAYGWYADNSDDQTHPIGQKRPNAFGVYDMHGNVYEWCEDWYDRDYYSVSPVMDPKGRSGDMSGVLRGGSWHNSPRFCRSAHRDWHSSPPYRRGKNFGFRVVLLDS
ncbi:MAG: formylglycine-generating enzyme family protein [Candidatus Hodarchaeota archaeon]